MKLIFGCEFSGIVREEMRRRGHDAWSCDLLPAEDGSPFHIQGDILEHLEDGWEGGGFILPAPVQRSPGLVGSNSTGRSRTRRLNSSES